jgi:hypothetical protein
MRDWIVDLSATKMPAEVGHEREIQMLLIELCVAIQGVELSAPLRVTEVWQSAAPRAFVVSTQPAWIGTW